MPSAPTSRRAVAEIDFSGRESAAPRIGNRSIHGFWHLFSSHFRQVLVAPQRRPDSGRVAWTWSEVSDKRPVGAPELAEVRRRLSEASRSLSGSLGGDRDDPGAGGASTLEGQVLALVSDMTAQLVARPDSALARFVCRTESGLRVHSWGAAVAAEPHYPDGLSGEVSGRVVSEGGRSNQAHVVLETLKGVRVAGVESRRDGVFKFEEIPAGSYRLRVADRDDFPAEGLTVDLEHGSATGLELRASASGTVSPKNAGSGGAPWYRRPIPLVAIFVALLGLGTGAWHFLGASQGDLSEKGPAGQWQAASGALAESSGHDKDTAHERLYSGLGWPSLSRLSKAFKSTFSAGPNAARVESKEMLRAGDGGIAADSPDGAKLRDQESAPAAALEKDQSGPTDREKPEAGRTTGTKVREQSRTQASAVDPTPEDSNGRTQVPAPAESPSQANPPVIVDSPESSLQPTQTIRKVIVVASRTDGQAPSAASALSPSLSSSPVSSLPGADPGGDGTTAAGASAADGSSNGMAAAGRGHASPSPSAGPATGAAAAPSPAPPEIVVAADADEDSKVAQPVDAKSTSSPMARAKSPTGKVAEKSILAAQGTAVAPPAIDSQSESAREAAAREASQEASRAALVRRQHRVAKIAAIPLSEKTPDDSASSSPGSAENKDPSALPGAGAGGSGKKAGLASTGAQSAGDTLAAAGASPGKEGESDPHAGGPSLPLVRIGRVHASPWKAQVVRDVILPTLPEPSSAVETVGSMRERLRSERLALMPPSLRQPQVKSGFSFEFTLDPSEGGNEPRWIDSEGNRIEGVVKGNSAEITTPTTGSSRVQTFVLAYKDGRAIARVSVDSAAGPLVTVSTGTRAASWFGIELDPSAGAWDWQLLSGGPLPKDWERRDRWLGGRGTRIDIPLDPSAPRAGAIAVALVDRATGCGIASSIAVQ